MKFSNVIAWFFTFLLFLWYFWNAWILRQADIYTLESLFYITKSLIVYDGYFPKLPTIGVTYPLIPFQIVLILYPIAGSMAPVVASVLGVTIVFRYLWHLGLKQEVHVLFYISIIILFFLNPSLIYLATSGGSYYMLLLSTVVLLHHLLSYVETNSTYNIAMSGIFYTCLIFVDFVFIWLFLFFLPVILLITSKSIVIQSFFEKEGVKALFRENQLQSFFIGKTISSAFMFTILPVATLLLYLFFNHLFTDHFFDFIDSAKYNYRVIEYNSILNVASTQQEFFFLRSINDFIISIVLLVPTLFLLLFIAIREPLKLYILLLPAFIIFFDLLKENVPQVTSEFYQLLLIISIFGILRLKNNLPKWSIGTLLVILSLIIVWFNHQYFLYESNRLESRAYSEVYQSYIPDSFKSLLTRNSDNSEQFLLEDSPFRLLSRSRSSDVYDEDAPLSNNIGNEYNSGVTPGETTTEPSDLRGITLTNYSFDFSFDSRIDGYVDRTEMPNVSYIGDNPSLQAAIFLRQISSRTSRILVDDATSYSVVALHGRVKDFVLPYENDYITFLSNPEKYADYILIPSRENPHQNFDMVYNLAPGLGSPDIPYRILFDNGVWMVMETINVLRLAAETQEPLIRPEIKQHEPFHSIVLVTNDQSQLSQRNFRRMRPHYSNLHLIPDIQEADGNQWIRWKIAIGKFPNVEEAVIWRMNRLPDTDYHYHYHSLIDPRLFPSSEQYDTEEQLWSLIFGRFTNEEHAIEIMQLWEDFGIDKLRIDQEEDQFLLLAGYYDDFTAAELLSSYLSQLSFQRVTVHELPTDL